MERKNSRASQMMQLNVQEMRSVFDKFDTNKDGKISRQEYKAALHLLGKGVAETEAAKSFQLVDTDGDGFIDFKEFMEMMRGTGEGASWKSDIQGAFQVFDLNGDKKISAEELMEVLTRMGERCSLDACRKMIRGVDADGDGFVDMDEFMAMMTRTMKVP
ncbi:calmodulin-like protein 30 [Mangifera indica]|uniref:calmodulin-like protein 30 n=1 Tax=Mangifera indica TaxID=29780 RepID=UPI001CF97C2D|nr:calmodulin-like protein 30 [Mangifera indica]